MAKNSAENIVIYGFISIDANDIMFKFHVYSTLPKIDRNLLGKECAILWGFDQKYKPAIDVSEKNKPQFFGKMITTTQQLFSLVIFFI